MLPKNIETYCKDDKTWKVINGKRVWFSKEDK